jgi:hypothetical protein
VETVENSAAQMPSFKGKASAAERLETARRTLALAENAVGVSSNDARRREATLGAAGQWTMAAGGWNVPECLATVLPRGLGRGMNIGVFGSRVVPLLLAGIASEAGAWSAFLGTVGVGWELAKSLGIDISRTVCVPVIREGARTQVLTAAVDGFDVVVLGSSIRLDARERRLLSKRALTRGCLLIGEGWDCRERVKGAFAGVEGINRGVGHIRAILVDVVGERHRLRLRVGAGGWEPVKERSGRQTDASSTVIRPLVRTRISSGDMHGHVVSEGKKMEGWGELGSAKDLVPAVNVPFAEKKGRIGNTRPGGPVLEAVRP